MTQYEDGPVKWMILPSICFMLVGMVVGIFISINGFILPDYFSSEYLSFGRLRPVHTGGVLLLWLLSANLGLALFYIQRLAGVPLACPRVAYAGVIIWWIAMITSQFSFAFGTNTGWEYIETPMWIGLLPTKPMIVTAWLLFAWVFFTTIAGRKHDKMYVSIWYTLGALIWGTIVFWVGGFSLDILPGGISKVNAHFFFVHNLVGMIFTPLGLASLYYYLPKLAGVPIYSHRLSMIGFWALAFVYGWVGAHHIIHGPMTQWVQTVSIIFSVWLFIPVFSAVYNVYMTLRPDMTAYLKSAPVRFLVMGNIFYLLTSVQGTFMALRNVNEITSKTDWVTGHSHIALYGAFTFMAMAGIYYVIPIIYGRPLWSERWANWHFTLNVLGSVPFMLALWVGGYLQGLLWSTWADGSTYAQLQSQLASIPFLKTIVEMRIWWMLRSTGGIIILIANALFVVNIFNTIILRPKKVTT